MSYVPSTREERQAMLTRVGASDYDALFAAVPKSIRRPAPEKDDGRSELEVSAEMQRLAGKNRVFPSVFRGAGAYRHYIPSIVDSVTSKEEFLTAYTPYQAEISQGVLQSIFEYQTMIAELLGMDVSNASVYDGATAAAEAAAMCRDRKRDKFIISALAHPMAIETVKTYCFGSNMELVVLPGKDGRTDMEALRAALDARAAGFYLPQPNFLGQIEDAKAVAETVHAAGAKLVMGVNPIAMGVLATPGECGADVAVGEGQPLGMPLAFGGPYLGFMAATSQMMRKLPGRIVGETTDHEGRRAFVLTLQAREQHIRREKASSNICSNQALCAMRAAVYLGAVGRDGLAKVASLCLSRAHYAAAEIAKVPGFALRYQGEFFHEFVTECPVEPERLMEALEKKGILGGLPVDGGVLWCVTEKNDRADIDALVAALREVAR